MSPESDSLVSLIEALEGSGRDYDLVVVDRTQPDAVQRLLEDAFDGQSVGVSERSPDGDHASDTVLLLADGEVVASSPLSALMDAYLLVNSDRFVTGEHGTGADDLPAVLAELTGVVLTLRGYPASNKEKLLLIALSRYIEGIALEADEGRLDSAFQRLSRIDDEYGTRRMYERLSSSNVDTHVYGVGDPDPFDDLHVTVHRGDGPAYRRSWFVVYVPETGTDHAGLLCWETGDDVWRGIWTFDPEQVRRIQRTVVTTL